MVSEHLDILARRYVFCVAWLYNRERLHQSVDYKTPKAVYRLTA